MKNVVVLGIFLLFAASALWFSFGRAQTHVIRADALQLHIEKYAGAGHHRSGGAGDVATRDWLASQLGVAGFEVELQSIPFDQWHHQEAYLQANNQRLEGFPLWWPPKDPALQSVSGKLRLISDARAGDIGVMYVDPFLLSSLKDEHREAISTAKETGLVGVIIITQTISGEPFAFNAEEAPADVAVLILGSRHADLIGQMIADDGFAELVLRGEYRPSETWNVIGRLDRAGSKIVAVSTPRTGWFSCGAERGPGIALFVELAHWASRQGDSDLIFVATGGHEIGHIGMNKFIGAGAPDPEKTANWVHLGASIAAREWMSEEERLSGASSASNTKTRWIMFSDNQTFSIWRHFYFLRYQFSPASVAVFGEVKDIHAAGYQRFFGFAGGHPYFHLPSDDADNTSGEMLVPVAHAIQEMMLSSL